MSDENTVDETKTPEGVEAGVEKEVAAKPETQDTEKDALIAKLRRHERESLKREEAALKRAQELEAKWNDRLISNALEKELAASGVKDMKLALKLANKSAAKLENDEVDAESLKSIVEALKTEAAILFPDAKAEEEKKPEPKAPSIKKASDGEATGGFEKEMLACKSEKEILAVMRKYGKNV